MLLRPTSTARCKPGSSQNDDADAEALVFALRAREYSPVASVEHDTLKRLATVRLLSPAGVKILLFASSGIEHETVERATVCP